MSFKAPSPNRSIRAASRRGFTLVEVLVATAILLILMTIILGLTTQVSTIWQVTDGQKKGRQDARALLSTISSDLKSALLPLNPSAGGNLGLLVNPSGVSGVQNRDCFFWQAALPRQGSQSDVVMVGYFVRWDTVTNPSKPVASLCRVYVQPSDAANYTVYSQPNSAWLTDAFLEDVAPGTLDPARNYYKGLMAENVLGLWLTLWDGAGNQIVIPAGGYDSSTATPRPAVIEVVLATLDPVIATQVTPGDASLLAQNARNAASADAFAATCAAGGASLSKVGKGLQLFRTRVFLEAFQ